MYRLFTSFFGLKRRIRNVRKIFRGPIAPFVYLGLFSVLLFGFISLTAGDTLKSLNNGNFSIIAGDLDSPQKAVEEDYFINSKEQFQPESPEFLLVENSSFQASVPPTTFSPKILGDLVGGIKVPEEKTAIIEYEVESGDSLWSLADKFDISLDTILWANNLNKNSILKLGQKLIILPVSGIIHHVKSGDTISGIASKYKGEVNEIIAHNNISNEGDIYIGDIVIVPNGKMPAPSVQYTAPAQVPLADSYFICPISSPCKVTQGLHWYNAIDFSHGKCGESVYAAAGGQVLKVKLTNSTSKWAFSGAGNNISILHPNGVVTTYGHIAASFVSVGQQVSQGQVIALVGGQPGTPGAGNSTGCHLHFGVSGARNPFAY